MTGDDLAAPAVSEALPERAVRTYPALLSTHADALAWARAGGPAGAVVVADYQVSPRGRAGLPWTVEPGVGLCFSMVLRPGLPAEREGWLYLATSTALTDVLGPAAAAEWPDTVLVDGETAAAAGVEADAESASEVTWAVLSVLVPGAPPPRAGLLARVVHAVERRLAEEPKAVLEDYRPRCRTLGRRVCSRLIPLGPAGPQFTGEAVDLKNDGALVLDTGAGRVAVRPQNLGRLDDA